MTDDQEPVQFVTAEIGDDLIVSFFVAKPHDPNHGRSIILMRDKKWEHLIAEWDRGVKVLTGVDHLPVVVEAGDVAVTQCPV